MSKPGNQVRLITGLAVDTAPGARPPGTRAAGDRAFGAPRLYVADTGNQRVHMYAPHP